MLIFNTLPKCKFIASLDNLLDLLLKAIFSRERDKFSRQTKLLVRFDESRDLSSKFQGSHDEPFLVTSIFNVPAIKYCDFAMTI